tara:strand:- start:1894 stop:2067 length:174 start_codon:yes stop_codon:yes gene_type:complete
MSNISPKNKYLLAILVPPSISSFNTIGWLSWKLSSHSKSFYLINIVIAKKISADTIL